MPLTPLPGEGIELPLSEYNRLRAFQGGGWFWDHENQQVIREALGDFLPRVEERTSGTRGGAVALFQHFVNGSEAAGKSVPVGAQMNRVPRAEYDRLQRALETLKRKAEDPHTDPNARRVIEKFCLPDPVPNPELYRLHGPAWNRRLLVLWGCEHEQGTSLPPVAALQRVSLEPTSALLWRRLPLWLLLLLLLLLAAFLTYRFWPAHRRDVPGEHPTVAQSASSVPSNIEASARPTADATSLPGLPASSSPAPSNNQPADRPASVSTPITPGAPETRPGTPSRLPADADAQASGNYPTSSPALMPDPAELGRSAVPASTISPTASPDSLGTRDTRQTTSTTSREARTTALNRQTTGSPTPGVSPATSVLPGSPQPASSPGVSPASAAPSPSSSTNTAGTSPAGLPAASPPGTPPSLEILNAPTSNPPHDGKLDLVLMATAHESDGTLAVLEITQWSVDDTRQQDRTGRDATGNQLALTLSPGKHKVNVVGTARGLPVECEAEVNVQIKSQGDVTVKSGAKK